MSSQVFGLVSGLDTGALLDATLQGARIPIIRAQNKQSGIQTQISKIGTITSDLNKLKEFIEDASNGEGALLAQTGTTGDEETLTVEAKGNAAPGNYDVDITQLAAFEKDRSAAYASKFDPVKAGTLTITTPGEDPVDVTIEDGDALQDVVGKVNNSGAAVSASIVFDGTSYYMQIVADESGHEVGGLPSDAIQVSETYTGATGTELALTEVVTAQNATFTLDGLAVEARSNNVSDVLEGVTMNLVKTGTTNFQVSVDKEASKEKMQEFVDSFNNIYELVRRETKIVENTNRDESLAGDTVINQLRADLGTMVTSQIPALDAGDSFSALSQFGIELDSVGKLRISSDDFDEALDGDVNAILDVFTYDTGDDTDPISDQGVFLRLLDVVERFVEGGTSDAGDSYKGLLVNRTDALNRQNDALDDRIERIETRVDRLEARLSKQFAALEQSYSNFNIQGAALGGLAF